MMQKGKDSKIICGKGKKKRVMKRLSKIKDKMF